MNWNGLSQGIQQGAQIGLAMRQRRDDLEREAALRQLQRDIELSRANLQRELALDARTQQSAENRRARRHTTRERLGAEAYGRERDDARYWFEGTERGADREEMRAERAARREMQERQLDQATRQFGQTYDLSTRDLGLRTRAQDWTENPQNPLNRYRMAHAADADDFSINGGAPGPAVPARPPRPAGPGAASPNRTQPREGQMVEQDGKRYQYRGGRWVEIPMP